MYISGHNEKDVTDFKSTREFIESIRFQEKEMVLTLEGKMVGAILTSKQYEWFLDQLDAQQDMSFIEERIDDLRGSQSLDDFKKELENDSKK